MVKSQNNTTIGEQERQNTRPLNIYKVIVLNFLGVIDVPEKIQSSIQVGKNLF